MKVRDLHRTDTLLLSFEAAGNPIAEGDEGLDGFLDALEAHAGELMPIFVKGKRQRKYSRESFRKALKEKESDFPLHWIWFERPPSPEVSFDICLFTGTAERNPDWSANFRVLPFSYFQDATLAEERSRKLVDLVRAWASRYPVTYAYIHGSADYQLGMNWEPNSPVRTISEQVERVFWLNLLGRKLVESIGRERVLSTPAHLLEELPGGNVLLVTRPTVADLASEDSRLAQARALVHLRPDLNFDEVMAQLREYSAAVVPVEPRFDPDIAELLSPLVDVVAISKRQRRIAEFNAYRPPEVKEWIPRKSALATDVPDPAKSIDRYWGYADDLALLLHEHLPEAGNNRPELLPSIDFTIWMHHSPDWYKRDFVNGRLTRWVGAYLGFLLVHQLNGEWVPRKNLLESQVLLGDRAWRPFLRALHYLQTRQSLIDYSMTQFYRVAERHVGQGGGRAPVHVKS